MCVRGSSLCLCVCVVCVTQRDNERELHLHSFKSAHFFVYTNKYSVEKKVDDY